MLHGQSVLVLGLGHSGLAMARWCARGGAQVTVADTREVPPMLAQLREQLPQARFVHSALDASLLQAAACRAVFRSPGLAPAQTAAVEAAARTAGLRVSGELGLFVEGLRALREQQGYAPQLLAVTGTNGKTTVTALTGHLLRRAGVAVAVAGNIGPTLLDTLGAALDAQASGTPLPRVWVLELSSFQLEGVQGFEPHAAALLNLSQDHLDWHGSVQSYAAAKARVFGPHTLRVLNRDDPQVLALQPEPVRTRGARQQQPAWLGFGAGLPERPGDYGLETVNGISWLVRAPQADDSPRRPRDEPAAERPLQRLMPAQALRIRGRHNATNALAALALAASTGTPLAPMLHGLREYRGEPHRVEPVGRLREVEYFDDSKGTNVGATVAALEGLGSERRLVVILGGDGKGQDFSPLAPAVARHARAVVLIGRDAPPLRAALQRTGVPLHDADSMEQAVRHCAALAQPGDAVLMSPACASFDMFDNYPHRARVFRAAVAALAHDAGVDLEASA